MITHKISWYKAKSILGWINNKRNHGFFNFGDDILGKFKRIVRDGEEGKNYSLTLNKEQAKKIVEALYVNSHYEDASPPEEMKFIYQYIGEYK